MKVIITGSRDYRDYPTILRVLRRIRATSIVEGGARGADRLARNAATELGIPFATVDAEGSVYGRAAGAIRNREMLNQHPDADAVLAFPLPHSIDTIDMCRESKRRDFTVLLFLPNPAIHPPSPMFENGYYPADLGTPVKNP